MGSSSELVVSSGYRKARSSSRGERLTGKDPLECREERPAGTLRNARLAYVGAGRLHRSGRVRVDQPKRAVRRRRTGSCRRRRRARGCVGGREDGRAGRVRLAPVVPVGGEVFFRVDRSPVRSDHPARALRSCSGRSSERLGRGRQPVERESVGRRRQRRKRRRRDLAPDELDRSGGRRRRRRLGLLPLPCAHALDVPVKAHRSRRSASQLRFLGLGPALISRRDGNTHELIVTISLANTRQRPTTQRSRRKLNRRKSRVGFERKDAMPDCTGGRVEGRRGSVGLGVRKVERRPR